MEANKSVKKCVKNDTNFDIVKFIEKNPISRLSSKYQDKLINQIREKFSDTEQQLFVCSFYTYLNYNARNDFIIDLDNVWKWTGFSRKDPAKRLLEKYFTIDIDYKILLHTLVEQYENDELEFSTQSSENTDTGDEEKTNRGGHNKEQILMTVNTFKKFCLKAGTKKADEIHNYYIKLEDLLMDLVYEESEEFKNNLTIKDKIIEKLEDKISKNEYIEKLNKEKMLLEKFELKKCVYIVEIEKDRFIKIGSSKNIVKRKKQLTNNFGKAIYLDVFETDNYIEVETNILDDDIIKKNIYRDRVNGVYSKEVVELSDQFNYTQLIEIVKKHIKNTSFMTTAQYLENKKLELEEKKLEYDMKLLDMLQNKDKNEILSSLKEIKESFQMPIPEQTPTIIKDDSEEVKVLKEELEQMKRSMSGITNYFDENKNRKNNGGKIQKLDPNNTKVLIKTYNNMDELINSPENKGLTKGAINASIREKTVYGNFRWNRIDKDADPDFVYDVTDIKQPEKQHKIKGTIFEINSDKTQILETFATKLDLMEYLGIGAARMNSIINKKLLHNNHYYSLIDDCPEDLIEKYDKPIKKYVFHKSKQIKKINPETKEEVIYNTLTEISNEYRVKHETIKKAIERKTECRGFLWEFC